MCKLPERGKPFNGIQGQRRRSDGAAPGRVASPTTALQLQQTAGNQATARLLSALQTDSSLNRGANSAEG